MYLKKILLLTATFTLSFSSVQAADKGPNNTKGLNVLDVLNLTLANDQRIEAARYSLKMAKEDVTEAKSYYRPKISGMGNLSVNKVPEVNFFGNTSQDGKSIYGGLELNQELLSFGRYSAKIKESKAGVEQTRYELRAQEDEVLLEAVRAYLDYGRTMKAHAAFASYVKDMENLEKRTKDKFENQLIGRSEYLLVRSRHQQAKAGVSSNQNEITRAYQRLAKLINKRNFTVAPSQADLYTLHLPKSLEKAIISAQSDNPRVKAAQHMVKGKREAASYAQASAHPKVSLKASIVRGKIEQRQTGEAIVGLNVEIPIYDGGSSWSRIRRARSDASRARSLLTDEVASAEERVTAAWKIYLSLQDSEKTWADAYQAEKEAVEEIQKEVDNKIRSLVVLLEAREQLVNAQVNATKAKYSRLFAGYELLTATGNLRNLIMK